jgi:gamma-glutamylcyclotransferase (GGCT)/AIG2-like uncharacterized protein YtfP
MKVIRKEYRQRVYTDQRHLYFAYGSNTHLDQMGRRCPMGVNLGPAVLPNHRLVFRGHADVQLDRQYDVQGLLWEVDDFDLESLDIYEGFPSYYLRHRVFVYDQYDNEHIAWVYTMAQQAAETAPTTGYYEICRTGYEQNRLDLNQLTEAADRVQYTDNQEDIAWQRVYSL